MTSTTSSVTLTYGAGKGTLTAGAGSIVAH
jgi:hypothetical protein